MDVVFDYCLEMNLLIGFVFLITAMITNFFPPKKINHLYGYRTPRSMKNQQNWDFAQGFSTKKMFVGGLVLMLFSFLKMVFDPSESIEIWIGVLSTIGVVIYVLFTTETELKKKETSCL